jgi:hypothetical protein
VAIKVSKSKPDSWYRTLAIVLGILAVVTLCVQIYRCSGQMTQTEVALFGILQFVFSVAFAWILSRVSYRREFEQSQRNFAIAAYRRIREIEHAVERLLSRIRSRREQAQDDVLSELDVIQEVVIGILATSRSSISDWADIIGDEIAVVEELEHLRKLKADELPSPREIVPDVDGELGTSDLRQRLESWATKMETLIEKLPTSLQVYERQRAEEEDSRSRALAAVSKDIQKNGGRLILEGFWESNAGFDTDIREFVVGDKFTVTLNFVSSRSTVLVLKDRSARNVGVIVNKYLVSSYDKFALAVFDALKTISFPVILKGISTPQTRSGRVYFHVETMPLDDLKEHTALGKRSKPTRRST